MAGPILLPASRSMIETLGNVVNQWVIIAVHTQDKQAAIVGVAALRHYCTVVNGHRLQRHNSAQDTNVYNKSRPAHLEAGHPTLLPMENCRQEAISAFI